MHASEGAEQQLHGASERLRRAHDKVAAAEATLARARRELQAAQRSEYGWTDGLAGRRHVAEALAALERYGWTFLDAVHWPGRPGVVIDHVGVGPGGIVVMFSRQWTGAVEVRGGVLRQNGIPRLRETAAVSAAAGAVCALLPPLHRTAVSAFVCAVQHDVRPATVAPGVNVVGVRDVARAVTALSPRLKPHEVEAVVATLHDALVGPRVPDQLTTRALTVYGDGPALPWPTRTEDALFEPAPDAADTGAVEAVGVVGAGDAAGAAADPGAASGPLQPAEPAGAAGAAGVVDGRAGVLDGWRPGPAAGAVHGVPLQGRHRAPAARTARSGRPSHHAVRGSDLTVRLLVALAGAGGAVAAAATVLGRALF